MKSNKEILKFSIPAIIENFLQMLVGISDTFLVAQIGLSAVSAVSLANNIITIYQAIFIALGVAVSSIIARTKENQKEKHLQTSVNAAIKLTVLLSIALGMISIFGSYPIAVLFGVKGTVFKYTIEYLAIVGGMIILLGLMTTFGSIIRAKGDTKTPMIISFWINVLNIILSSIFIFVFHFGVIGSALGAVFSRGLGVFLLYLQLKEMRPNRNFWKAPLDKKLFGLTLPVVGERLAMRLGDLIIIALLMSFGEQVFAGNAIGESITQFNYMPVFGMATVTVILIGQEFSKGRLDHVREYLKRTYWMSALLMLSISFLILVFSKPLNGLFTADSIAISASQTVILFSFLSSFFVAGTTTYTAAFQGLGNTKLPFFTTLIGMFVIRIVLGFLFGLVFGWGITGVWFGVLLDNLFRFVFLKIRFTQLIK